MPSAGWYPDPSDPSSSQRYWDGSAWTEHTEPATAVPAAALPVPAWGAPPPPVQPPPTDPVQRDHGAKVVVLAVVAVLAALVLVIGGAAALILEARDDGDPVDPSTSSVILPTTMVTLQPQGGSGQGQATDAAQLTACQMERAAVTTAIETAKASSQASGTAESPDEYLMDPASNEFYTWAGSSPEEWTLQPIGTPPC